MSDGVTEGATAFRVAFIHPDLGIGGAERLVVDAALGLQRLGHTVDIYTSYHDPGHSFEETRDGSLNVHYIKPPFPRSIAGKLHILFAHLRQLHLTLHLLRTNASKYDVFFADQLSTCIPLLRYLAGKRVVFYCHFPDKLLADGAYVEGAERRRKGGLLKRVYRLPMDWFEEKTTGLADVILANSSFTARVFKTHFSIPRTPTVVYPGINISAYDAPVDLQDEDVVAMSSDRPTLLSLNRFEKKKNAALAFEAFAILRDNLAKGGSSVFANLRLVLAGGYDPRLQDNIETLDGLVQLADRHHISYFITTPTSKSASLLPSTAPSASAASLLILLNFTTAQRSALLKSSSTLALLYTPTNEHFGIGPVEGMICGLPVLACDSGGPTESVVDSPDEDERTGWLRPPIPSIWAQTLEDIINLSVDQREALAQRAKRRAREKFGMDAMARGIEEALVDAAGMGPVNVAWIRAVGVMVFSAMVVLYAMWMLS